MDPGKRAAAQDLLSKARANRMTYALVAGAGLLGYYLFSRRSSSEADRMVRGADGRGAVNTGTGRT
jgi:hypothetical protein